MADDPMTVTVDAETVGFVQLGYDSDGVAIASRHDLSTRAPMPRREAASVLRKLADTLDRLADDLDTKEANRG